MRAAYALILGALLALSGCAGGDRTVVSSGERYQHQSGPVGEYLLGAGDRLRVIVFNEERLSGEFLVGARGVVSLPLIGEVDAVGKTVEQIASVVTTRLADGYVRDPHVSVEVMAYRPFFVLGEVGQPGQFPYVVGLTASSAVATAGGFTPRANKKVIYIRGENESDEVAYELTPGLRVYPGDTIRVGETFF
ncbi:polysaccharide biosynthesis/export family protein [Stakelama tenebrarum]|uniref:Polysaccharide export protein n=1 Tax=Stakelama tenebrarum TaxID=2711215 RepID=A0A6G6Y3U6_9SPHN|nr:polysaccharide biosynthesis/export family protein [Sphingosinithalassobacter tenebrarum]QIG79521.1 polysaccharide export protein [Sphingosinithalassobacter tenebrarum]